MDLTYFKVKGTVGTTPVDLEFSVPVSDIIKAMPRLAKEFAKNVPTIMAEIAKIAEHAK